MVRLKLFLLLCIAPGLLPAQELYSTLLITFTDIRSDAGLIRMGLYTCDEEWTDTPKYSFAWNKKDLENGKLKVKIDSLQRGTYACAVLDDEDENCEMNYTLGLPREGWGMSSNPSFLKLKKPGFETCGFEADAPVLTFEIKINYLMKK